MFLNQNPISVSQGHRVSLGVTLWQYHMLFNKASGGDDV